MAATVGKEYTLLRQHNLMEIRLVVFARTSLLPVIGNVRASSLPFSCLAAPSAACCLAERVLAF